MIHKPFFSFSRVRTAFAALLSIAVVVFVWHDAATAPVRPTSTGDAPNVIFILVDTLRSDHLSMNGYVRETSPFLDSLAAESIVFSHVMANGSWTAPNVETFFTGLHPEQHGLEYDHAPSERRLHTLSEQLYDSGYSTLAVSANPRTSTKFHFDQGFEEFSAPKKDNLHYPDISTTVANANELLTARDRSRAFFLYLHTMNIHGPYTVPLAVRDRFLDETAGSFSYYGEVMHHIMQQGRLEYRDRVTDAVVQDLTNQYDAGIAYTDEQLAEFIAHLKQQGLYDNTLLIVAADHGEELYDHEGFSHGYSLYNEILTTPLLIKPPKTSTVNVDATIGTIHNELVQQIDIFPTVLTLLGMQLPDDLPGQYLLSDTYTPQPIISKADWTERAKGYSIIDWPYKLIETQTDYQGRKNAVELYQLEQDPKEQENIATAQPEQVKRLHVLLKQYKKQWK